MLGRRNLTADGQLRSCNFTALQVACHSACWLLFFAVMVLRIEIPHQRNKPMRYTGYALCFRPLHMVSLCTPYGVRVLLYYVNASSSNERAKRCKLEGYYQLGT